MFVCLLFYARPAYQDSVSEDTNIIFPSLLSAIKDLHNVVRSHIGQKSKSIGCKGSIYEPLLSIIMCANAF